MNTKPISTAHDSDLRFSQTALERAALRVQQLAAPMNIGLIMNEEEIIGLLTLDMGGSKTMRTMKLRIALDTPNQADGQKPSIQDQSMPTP